MLAVWLTIVACVAMAACIVLVWVLWRRSMPGGHDVER